jgi:hypothetical protein
MQANKIGTKLSLFWIAWAFVVEKLGNYAMTDKVFQKGIRMFVTESFLSVTTFAGKQNRKSCCKVDTNNFNGDWPVI